MSLSDIDAYIQQNGHLPGMPSEAEVEKNGLNVGDMEKLQMQKVEELTLDLIDATKEIKELKKELEDLKAEIQQKSAN